MLQPRNFIQMYTREMLQPRNFMDKGKVNNTALHFTILTGCADLRLMVLQPGRAMGSWMSAMLCFHTPFQFTFPRFLQAPIYSWVDSG